MPTVSVRNAEQALLLIIPTDRATIAMQIVPAYQW
jgi:hypothetical protein